MAWQLAPRPHCVYARNPLVAVIVDLRFSPILRVAKGIPEFQDLVRDRFPKYQDEATRFVDVQPLKNSIEVREEKVFSFLGPEQSKLCLTTGALTLEARGHKDRENLIADFGAGLAALTTIFSPIQPLRLGLRYINVIDRDRQAPGRSVAWSELLNEPYVLEPTGKAGNDALFNVEVTSPVEENGSLTLRYGLLREPGTKKPFFRLDLDRYTDTGLGVSEIPGLLRTFSDDIFRTFMTFAGPALVEWMEGDH